MSVYTILCVFYVCVHACGPFIQLCVGEMAEIQVLGEKGLLFMFYLLIVYVLTAPKNVDCMDAEFFCFLN